MDPSRLSEPFKRAVEAALPSAQYAGVWRYSVVSCDFENQTISATPFNPTMPAHTAIPMAIPGIKLNIAPNATVMIGFAECNPTLPFVAQYPQDPTAIITMQLRGGTVPVALQGMQVSVTIPAGSIGSFQAGAVVAPAAPLAVTGTIVGGSATIFGTP
jgi:hypothetical protein